MPQNDQDGQEPSRSYLPALAATAGGLGAAGLTYAMLRRRRLSNDPRIRAIQEASKGKFTRIMQYGNEADISTPRKWLDRMLLAGGGDVRYMPDIQDALDRTGKKKFNIEGAVRHYKRTGDKHVVGDVNLSATESGRAIYDKLRNDKWKEYEYFNKLAPGAMGQSEHIPDVLKRLGYKSVPSDQAGKEKMFSALQEDLRKRYRKGFFLKDVNSADTGGQFPTDKHDFVNLFRRPGDVESAGPQRTLHKIIEHGPQSAMVQERLPIEQGSLLAKLHGWRHGELSTKELRVHVINGAVFPEMTNPRFDSMMKLTGRHHIRNANTFAQDLVNRLPKEHRNASFAMDIAPVAGGGYKLVESNPSGVSGFFDPRWNMTGGLQMHKAFTGQHSQMASGLGAAGAGAAAAAGIYGGNRLMQNRVAEPPPEDQRIAPSA